MPHVVKSSVLCILPSPSMTQYDPIDPCRWGDGVSKPFFHHFPTFPSETLSSEFLQEAAATFDVSSGKFPPIRHHNTRSPLPTNQASIIIPFIIIIKIICHGGRLLNQWFTKQHSAHLIFSLSPLCMWSHFQTFTKINNNRWRASRNCPLFDDI